MLPVATCFRSLPVLSSLFNKLQSQIGHNQVTDRTYPIGIALVIAHYDCAERRAGKMVPPSNPPFLFWRSRLLNVVRSDKDNRLLIGKRCNHG